MPIEQKKIKWFNEMSRVDSSALAKEYKRTAPLYKFPKENGGTVSISDLRYATEKFPSVKYIVECSDGHKRSEQFIVDKLPSGYMLSMQSLEERAKNHACMGYYLEHNFNATEISDIAWCEFRKGD